MVADVQILPAHVDFVGAHPNNPSQPRQGQGHHSMLGARDKIELVHQSTYKFNFVVCEYSQN